MSRPQRARRLITGFAALALSICIATASAKHLAPSSRTATAAKVAFVDVGQGDGVVMRIGSKIIVSDAGQFNYDKLDAALNAVDAKQIDVAILSHPHSDHVTDFLSLFDEWAVKKVVMSHSAYWQGDSTNKAVMAAIKREGLKPTYVHASQKFTP